MGDGPNDNILRPMWLVAPWLSNMRGAAGGGDRSTSPPMQLKGVLCWRQQLEHCSFDDAAKRPRDLVVSEHKNALQTVEKAAINGLSAQQIVNLATTVVFTNAYGMT
ncbi:hypothetical protein Hamer_G019478 [Homarus americanus]|uniref:Uncharacterized protein n=1 Tax=Homarus americanus TaxID=6706 RepID=A0A8J5JHQ8_HOMAM|nr:hypothetical protein Hamer_G019478 [Homarus americanus]